MKMCSQWVYTLKGLIPHHSLQGRPSAHGPVRAYSHPPMVLTLRSTPLPPNASAHPIFSPSSVFIRWGGCEAGWGGTPSLRSREGGTRMGLSPSVYIDFTRFISKNLDWFIVTFVHLEVDCLGSLLVSSIAFSPSLAVKFYNLVGCAARLRRL